MDGTEDGSDRQFSSPKWGPDVVDALRKLLTADERGMLGNVTLISAELERDVDGLAFLRAVYDDSNHQRRIGVRRQLDGKGPLAHMPGMSLAESMAYDIAHGDMAEPLGTYWYLLVEDDNGVWWWGDGYPGLTP
jgi:hypothetical protein